MENESFDAKNFVNEMVKFGDKILFLIKFTPEVLQNKDIYIEREGR